MKAADRKKLIIAGVSTEVCLALPAIRATGLGYDAYGVIEASGTFSETIGRSLSKKTRLNCPLQ